MDGAAGNIQKQMDDIGETNHWLFSAMGQLIADESVDVRWVYMKGQMDKTQCSDILYL